MTHRPLQHCLSRRQDAPKGRHCYIDKNKKVYKIVHPNLVERQLTAFADETKTKASKKVQNKILIDQGIVLLGAVRRVREDQQQLSEMSLLISLQSVRLYLCVQITEKVA